MRKPLKTKQKKAAGNPRGRPRAFNEEQALDAATRVFADKGYEGASLAELTAAMGINRVSMYATFGNKEALFVKAMERFTQGTANHFAACLAGSSAKAALERLLRDGVMMFTNPDGPGVCFVTQGPIADQDASEETRRLITRKRGEVELSIKRRFDRAIEEGELPKTASAADLARFYSVIIQGLALQAQHGGTKEQLMRVVDVAMDHWPRTA